MVMGMATALILASAAQSNTSTASTATASMNLNERMVHALERSAKAAERAADAAARAASAAEKAAGVQPEAAAAAAPATKGWSGTLGGNLIWIAGNAQSLTFSVTLALEKKTEDWIYAVKGNAIYGQALVQPTDATIPATTQVVALAGGLLLRGDRRFTKSVTGYLAAGADADHIKSVEYRLAGEAGSGITWLERTEGDLTLLLLRTDLGFRYARESRFQYYPTRMNLPDVDIAAPRLGIAFRYALSKDLLFTEDAEILPNIIGDFRYLFNSLSKLSVRITNLFSFASSLQLAQDSAPAPGKKNLDSILTVGIELAL
jgi:hypothetical protein